MFEDENYGAPQSEPVTPSDNTTSDENIPSEDSNPVDESESVNTYSQMSEEDYKENIRRMKMEYKQFQILFQQAFLQ